MSRSVAALCAHVGLLSSMRALVLGEVVTSREAPAARGAGKRLLVVMQTHVNGEVGRLTKTLVAYTA